MICKDATIPGVLLNNQRLFGGSAVSDSRLSCHGNHCYWVMCSLTGTYAWLTNVFL